MDHAVDAGAAFVVWGKSTPGGIDLNDWANRDPSWPDAVAAARDLLPVGAGRDGVGDDL